MPRQLDPEDQKINDMLNFDPLGAAEDVTGRSYKGDDEVTLLGMLFASGQGKMKDKVLSERGDTTFSMNMDDYRAVVERLGFVLALEDDLIVKENYGERRTREEKVYVYVHPENGAVLVTDSYQSTPESEIHRNGAHVYFRWQSSDSAHCWPPLGISGGMEEAEDGTLYFRGNFDAREALAHNMSLLAKHGTFVPWSEYDPEDSRFSAFNLAVEQDYSAVKGREGTDDHRVVYPLVDEIHRDRVERLSEQAKEILGVPLSPQFRR
jgi:hypothetical protein